MHPQNRLVAILYGKGGVGKSTVSSHLAASFARMGRRVLLVGCDPKADTSLRLLHGETPPTVIGLLKDGRLGHIDRVIVPSPVGVDVIETGGAEPGTGCSGRGVVVTADLLDRSPAVLARYDTLVFDVLGDVVCGGFVAPMRFGSGHNVFIVSSEEPASLFAANNVARMMAHDRHRRVGLGGIIANLREGVDREPLMRAFAERIGTRLLEVFSRDPLILEAEYHDMTTVEWAPDAPVTRRFAALAEAIAAMDGHAPAAPATPMLPDAFRQFLRDRRDLNGRPPS